ncbi:hypothetical protein HNQ80_003808 [Anaerosolibacter carboniphilus]|uniref:Uncharacterized protein n=1 Tax=Anaerosolibacter carboniphilus TaxID=1417629 RepID=A0A841L5U6_9FIRM|nr:hypothetical protein [Anaerosolibacter carboniphilus]MBB6217685.1 hypothetical protein [Anaerosolibacter carboniphilus]
METSKRLVANITICLIILAITLVFFFVGFSQNERTIFDYTGLVFVLISEFALFTGLILLSINNIYMKTAFVRAGMITTLSGYWILTTLIFLCFKRIFTDNLGAFITTQIIIMGIAAIICISLFVASSNVQSSSKENVNRRDWLQNGENIIFSLKNDIKFQPYRQYLDELYETLRSSDKIATDIALDKEINNEIIILSDYLKNEEVKEITMEQYADKIISMIKERNMLTLQSKRGAF